MAMKMEMDDEFWTLKHNYLVLPIKLQEMNWKATLRRRMNRRLPFDAVRTIVALVP